MIQYSDSFVIFPGGAGTVQEMLALLIFKAMGNELMKEKPVVIFNRLNPDGETRFWDKLIALLKPWEGNELFSVVEELEEIIPAIEKDL